VQVMTGTNNAQQENHTVKPKTFDLNRSLLSSLLSSHHALNVQNDGGETMQLALLDFWSSRVTIGVGESRMPRFVSESRMSAGSHYLLFPRLGYFMLRFLFSKRFFSKVQEVI
jgi:hypothetical protein